MIFFLNQEGFLGQTLKKSLMVMKLTMALTLFCVMNISATVYSKSTKLSFDVHDISIKEVLKQVENQTKFRFIYESGKVNMDKKVSIHAKDQTVEQILEKIFKEEDINYVVTDNNFILIEPWKNTELEKKGEQQSVSISGTVTDEQGVPMSGVNIAIKGTTTGVITDINGKYNIVVPGKKSVLVFSFVGFVSRELQIGDQSVVNVILKEDVKQFEEVVVIGYGTMKKSDLTGSVAKVTLATLLDRPSINAMEALQGRVAGVNVQKLNGAPGQGSRVRIRGNNSINATSDPLYVIDGIVGVSNPELINPNDIESVEVLKDASATAIYGARGANGVIIITTKRGVKEGSEISYNGYVSFSQAAKRLELLNSEEFMDVYNTGFANSLRYNPNYAARPNDPKNVPLLFDANGKPLYDTDWQDETFRNAVSHNHQLSIRGGTSKTTYGAFLGYTSQEGLAHFSKFERFNGKLVFDSEVKSWLKVGGSLSFTKSTENASWENDVFRTMCETNPLIPVKHPDGTWGRNNDFPGLAGKENAVRLASEIIRDRNRFQSMGDINFTFKILPDLDFKTNLAVDVSNSKFNIYQGRELLGISNTQKGRAYINTGLSLYWQNENYFTWNKVFNEDHRLKVMAGFSWQERRNEDMNAQTQNFIDDFYAWHNLNAGTTTNPSGYPQSGDTRWALNSYFLRANYSLMDKYLFTLTARYDGSSKFGKNNKYALFPSGAFAWRISNEDFLKDNKVISDLKLRTSIGATGNQEIPVNKTQQLLSNVTPVFGGVRAPGLAVSSFGNPNLRWEETIQVDAGFDLSLLSGRIDLRLDLYHKRTNDLLLNAPIPYTTGLDVNMQNIGSMENRGVEVTLNTTNITNDNFSWDTGITWSLNRNKIVKLGENDDDIFPTSFIGYYTSVLRVGEPVGSLWGRDRIGTWGTHEAAEAAKFNRKPGDLKYRDIVADDAINGKDEMIIGNSEPKWSMNLSNTFRYRNFDFTFDIQFVMGFDVMNMTKHVMEDRTGFANSYRSVLNAWTPDNQNTMLAELRHINDRVDTYPDSWWVEDGSFIRGQNFVLGYTLPERVLAKTGLRNFRVYASGQNLFCISDYSGYDPEVATADAGSFANIEFFAFPKPRTVTLGVNFSF